jgi:heterodisulfide reductase subunit B
MEPAAPPANHRGGERRVRYGFDPGCSRPPGGGPCDDTAVAVARALGLAFEEIEDPSGFAAGSLVMNGIPAYARVGRLLAHAARQLSGSPDAAVPPVVVSPCGGCFRTLSRASASLSTHPDLRETVVEELASAGLSLDRRVPRVRHLLDVLVEDAGTGAIRSRVRRPLTGLRVAPYAGCSAGGNAGAGGSPEGMNRARRLAEVVAALGAEVVDLPLAAHCCGGRAAEASEETATSLQYRIYRSATEAGADAIATACRRCLRNLSAGREPVNRRFRTRFATPVRDVADLAAEAFALSGDAPSPPGLRRDDRERRVADEVVEVRRGGLPEPVPLQGELGRTDRGGVDEGPPLERRAPGLAGEA